MRIRFRLHPKLQTICNGNDAVNCIRAGASATVVSRLTRAELLRKRHITGDTPVLNRNWANSSDAGFGVSSTEWSPQRKLSARTIPRNALANVFLETGRSDVTEQKWLRAVLKGRNIRTWTCGDLVRAEIPLALLGTFASSGLRGPRSGAPSAVYAHPAEPIHLDVPLPTIHDPTIPRRPAKIGNDDLHEFGRGVIIGIIDVGGFDFAHPDFLDSDNRTRFIRIWDQGGDFRKSPANFDYGSEFTKVELDKSIAASNRPGGLPAHYLERQSQLSEGSHGTHVASIAAGNSGICPDSEIAAVLVSLPGEDDEFEQLRSTFCDSTRIADAVWYLLDLADKLKKPISINISLGTNGGAHDGTNGVSAGLDRWLVGPGRCISVAAGNAGQDESTSADDFGWIMGRIHTSGRIPAPGLAADLEWAVAGIGNVEDYSDNELEIWYSGQDRFTAMLQAPDSDDWVSVRPGQFIQNRRLQNGTRVSIYNELFHPSNGDNYVALYLSPNYDQWQPVAPGIWRVRLIGDDVRDGRYHGWIERDNVQRLGESEFRHPFRFPSFFTSGSNVDSHSVNSLGCGRRVVCVANLDERSDAINITSSQGPTRDGRAKPDVAAPGSSIVAANGFAGATELWAAKTGTSMASPYVAGTVGLMLAANGTLTAAQCIAILRRTARPLPGDTYAWTDDAGFGRIDAAAAVAEANRFDSRHEID